MARYDLTKPADRVLLRDIATGEKYAGHPLAATLVAALDLLDRLSVEALERAKADGQRRRTDQMREAADPLSRLFGGLG